METRPTGDTWHLARHHQSSSAANMLAPELCLICSCLVCKIFDDPKNFKVNLRDISFTILSCKLFLPTWADQKQQQQQDRMVHRAHWQPGTLRCIYIQSADAGRHEMASLCWQYNSAGDTALSGTRDAGKKRHVNTRCDCGVPAVNATYQPPCDCNICCYWHCTQILLLNANVCRFVSFQIGNIGV